MPWSAVRITSKSSAVRSLTTNRFDASGAKPTWLTRTSTRRSREKLCPNIGRTRANIVARTRQGNLYIAVILLIVESSLGPNAAGFQAYEYRTPTPAQCRRPCSLRQAVVEVGPEMHYNDGTL